MFEKVPHLYIADGHHRAAAAYNVGKMRRDQAMKEGREVSENEQFHYFMTIIYPSSNLHIMDYNRVIKSFNQMPV